jgi:hypothetical protein
MSVGKQQLLQALKQELAFLEQGGYADFEKKSWRPAMFFEDSPICPNHSLSEKLTPCTECALIRLVPIGKRTRAVPCRDIPLNQEGETLQSLYETATRNEIEWKLDEWLRKVIERLESELKNQTFPLESETSLKLSHA